MKINRYLFAVAVLVVFLGTIEIFQAANFWSVSGRVDRFGDPVKATGQDVSEIKGWMKLGDVLKAYNLPADEAYARFNIPPSVSLTVELKQIHEQVPDFTVDDFRNWLAERTGTKTDE